ncbi:MAG: DUF2188 domain-containing protein [Phenylobacterium sp.]|nr:DUF2188 domain-containing protein [Phenylobacterium sp.]MDO9215754.1 DUF2188 domain-containing protein [Lacisediminimonas sp.]
MKRLPATYRVGPTGDGGWAVRDGHGAKTFATQSEAVAAAQTAVRSTGGELTIQAANGRVRKSFTLGRSAMEKLNAVEGIALPARSKQSFARFDRQGLGADARRAAIKADFIAKAKS